MNDSDFLEGLRGRGLTIRASGRQLVVAPRRSLTADDIEYLRAHRATLLALLASDSDLPATAPESEPTAAPEPTPEPTLAPASTPGRRGPKLPPMPVMQAQVEAHREERAKANAEHRKRIIEGDTPERIAERSRERTRVMLQMVGRKNPWNNP